MLVYLLTTIIKNILNNMNYIKANDYKGENRFESPNTGKSQTVPDKTLTIEQMLYKSLNGSLPPIQHAAEYTGTSVRPQPKDYSDVYALLDAHKTKVSSIRERQIEEARQKIIDEKEAYKKQIISEYELENKNKAPE